MPRFASLLLLLAACSTADSIPDADGDGTADPHDCAPDDPAIHLDAPELCNEVDDNCDGEVDEGVKIDTWPDLDADGHGHGSAARSGCPVNGWSDLDDDCDDKDAAVHPGAEDVCNGKDDNCDGVKDAADTTWFADADGDTYGDDTTAVATCSPPAGYVVTGGDCDDADAAIHPGATELCNTLDDDCDGTADLGYETTWYSDADGDGHGSPLGSQTTCAPPSGWVLTGDDCRPSEATAYPGAPEACNDIDDDCDGTTDEGFDVDGDGHYDAVCSFGDDCDDLDDSVYPKAHEVCEDGLDQDCDGVDIHCGFSGTYASADATVIASNPPVTNAGGHLNIGDVNGDGYDDVVTNGYFFSSTLLVTYGPLTEDVDLTASAYRVYGDSATVYGTRSLGVADVNGDGYDDVALGAPYGVCGTYIAFGPITADVDLTTDADASLTTGSSTYGGHGTDVGDITGDGVADLIVGAYYTGRNAAGTVYVKNGPLSGDYDKDDADSVLSGTYSSGYAGRWIRAGKDMDGDGIGDLVVAAPYENSAGITTGTLYVFYGPTPSAADLTDGDVVIAGPGGALLGEYRTFSQGDANGDGYADLAAAAYSKSEAWLFYSPITATDTSGADAELAASAATGFGTGISIEDIDETGTGDLLVGSGGGGAGAAYLYWDLAPGSYTEADADAKFTGAALEQLGYSAAYGDMDGDGRKDILLGAMGLTGSGTGTGGFIVEHFAW